MKYINGLDSEHADETCPKNEKVLWTCLSGFPKISVVTLYTSKDFCLRVYTETGGIFDLPFSGYVTKGAEDEQARVFPFKVNVRG